MLNANDKTGSKLDSSKNKEKLTLSLTLKGDKLPAKCCLSLYYMINKKFTKTGKTEILEVSSGMNSITFKEQPKVDYIFETHQDFKLVLSDCTGSSIQDISESVF
jgi:hypothetical protein